MNDCSSWLDVALFNVPTILHCFLLSTAKDAGFYNGDAEPTKEQDKSDWYPNDIGHQPTEEHADSEEPPTDRSTSIVAPIEYAAAKHERQF